MTGKGIRHGTSESDLPHFQLSNLFTASIVTDDESDQGHPGVVTSCSSIISHLILYAFCVYFVNRIYSCSIINTKLQNLDVGYRLCTRKHYDEHCEIAKKKIEPPRTNVKKLVKIINRQSK